jgi:hypothetical protein
MAKEIYAPITIRPLELKRTHKNAKFSLHHAQREQEKVKPAGCSIVTGKTMA